MAYQVQMNTIDESGNATPIYPKNRKKDVFVGAFEAAADAVLPGESADETLDKSLSLIKVYLSKLKTAAYANVAESITDDATTVPSTKLLFNVNKIAEDALPKSGGEMSGDITFSVGKGLKFTYKSGYTSSLVEQNAYLTPIQFSTSGNGLLEGGLASSNLIPYDDGGYLGLTNRRWNIYANYLFVNNIGSDIISTSNDAFNIGSGDKRYASAYISRLTSVDKIEFARHSNATHNTDVSFKTVSYKDGPSSYGTALELSCNLYPSEDLSLCLGDSSRRFRYIYCDDLGIGHRIMMSCEDSNGSTHDNQIIFGYDTATSIETLNTTTSILPNNYSGKYSLGSDKQYWGQAYVNTVYATCVWARKSTNSTDGTIGLYGYPFGYVYTEVVALMNKNKEYVQLRLVGSGSASVYASGGSYDDSAALYVGSSSANLKITAQYFEISTTHAPVTKYTINTISDPKVKNFTDDINNMEDNINTIFELLNIESYKYRYDASGKIFLGVDAQKLYNMMMEIGVNVEDFNVITCEYNMYLSRGDDKEDDKYYTRFFTISYTDLQNLAIIKMQLMNKEIQELKTQNIKLEERLTILENKFN